MYAKEEDESTEDSHSEDSSEETSRIKEDIGSINTDDGLLLFRFMDEIE